MGPLNLQIQPLNPKSWLRTFPNGIVGCRISGKLLQRFWVPWAFRGEAAIYQVVLPLQLDNEDLHALIH